MQANRATTITTTGTPSIGPSIDAADAQPVLMLNAAGLTPPDAWAVDALRWILAMVREVARAELPPGERYWRANTMLWRLETYIRDVNEAMRTRGGGMSGRMFGAPAVATRPLTEEEKLV